MPADLRRKRSSGSRKKSFSKSPLQKKRNPFERRASVKAFIPKEFDFHDKKSVKQSITKFIVEDFLRAQEKQPTAVAEEFVTPIHQCQESATQSNQYKCKVSDSKNDDDQWSGFAKVNVSPNAEDLICWRLYSSTNNSECFVFACYNGGSLRYITFQEEGKPFKFETFSTHPTDIDMDNGGEKKDPRAFYWRPDGSSGHLVLACNTNLAARLDADGQIVADVRDGWTNLWSLSYW